MTRWYCRLTQAANASKTRRPFALPNAKAHYAPDRPAAIDHIALTLSFDFKEHIVFGSCRTTFTVLDGPLRSLEMDSASLAIKSVRGDGGKKLKFETTGGKLRIELPQTMRAGKSATVTVDYEARQPRQGIYFVSPDAGYPKKPVQVWTQGQDQDAHYWFPCIDYPNAKATTEVTATVPAGFFVLSNGVLVSTKSDKRAKTKTYHWKMEQPHVTYLVSCVAGKFSERIDMLDKLPVSYYVPPGREADGERSFGKTPKMVQFYNDKLKIPYPYGKYAQIAVADFIFGGMENTTATTQTDTTLHDERAHLDFSSDGLVAHELAHQWFGDLLTCKDWSHAWLNESFATYFDLLFREHDIGLDEFNYHRFVQAQRYFDEDRERYRRPIVTNVYAEPIDLFDRHLYEKGACVLHMVRRMLGDDLWWRAINRYVSDNKFGTVETIDLIRAIETITGRNFRQFFDQWVMRPGHPELKVQYSWDDEANAAQVRVTQSQDTGDNTPIFSLPLTIAFGFNGKKPEARFEVFADQKEHTFSFALPQKPDVMYFDPEGDILKTIDLDVPREMLLRQIRNETHLLARVDAIRALAKDPSPEVVDGLAGVLGSGAFWGVKQEAAHALGRIRTEQALHALKETRTVKHPKARRAVATALGSFRGDEPCEILEPLLRHDASYFVEAAAAASIGKTRSKKAYALLVKALKKESWNDVIRAGVFRGLAELGDDRAIGVCIEWTEYGKPAYARDAAIEALGKLGQGKKNVRLRVIELLDDKNFHTQMAALDALEELHDAEAIPAIERLASQDLDGRLKRRATEVVRAIREQMEKPAELKQLRDEIESLRETNKTLLDRLERLESKAKTDGRVRSRNGARTAVRSRS